jgi:hypothetical protein
VGGSNGASASSGSVSAGQDTGDQAGERSRRGGSGRGR